MYIQFVLYIFLGIRYIAIGIFHFDYIHFLSYFLLFLVRGLCYF
jgi:hypothetical protein